MKIENLQLKIGLLIALVTLAVSPQTANAAGISLGIYPPVLQIEALPPASIQAQITIQNLGDESVDLDILLKPFTAGSENGHVAFLPDNVPIEGADPLIFQRMQIIEGDHVVKHVLLAPGQQKNLTLHIGIPKDEPPSDYYFSIVFLSKAESTNDQISSSQTPGGIATNVLLSIGPRGKAKGTIEEFSTPLFLEGGPVPFTVRIKNTSQHVIVPQGTILITNMFNQIVGKIELLPVNILAGTIRAIPDSLQSPDATPSANFNLARPEADRGELLTFNSQKALWPESFLFGPYTATLTIALSEAGPIFTRTTRFIGLPWQMFLGFIIAIFIILSIKKRIKKHLN